MSLWHSRCQFDSDIDPNLNEYRLLGDKVIHNYIRGMDYEGAGILHDHAYTKVSVRKKR